MDPTLQRIHQAFFKELTIHLAAISANVDLLQFLVSDLLKGDDEELIPDHEEFAAAIDDVVYRAALEVVDCIVALREQAPLLTPGDREKLVEMASQFDKLSNRWSDIVEAVNDIWKLRRLPH